MTARIVSGPGLFLALLLVLPAIGHCQDASGVWKGRWTANASAQRGEHGGALRVRLRPISNRPNTYRGVFTGRFAVLIPYFYRAEVHQTGSQLVSVKRLGPLGEYRMQLSLHVSQMSGSWNAGSHSGAIQLRRVLP